MSTGMQSIESVFNSIQIIRDSGVPYALLEVLICTHLLLIALVFLELQSCVRLFETLLSVLVITNWSHIALASVALVPALLSVTLPIPDTVQDISCSMDPSELSFLILDLLKSIHVCTTQNKELH